MILSWLAIHGLSVEEYIALLEQQRDSDGLEVWAVSIALGQPINVIFEDAVWSTAAEGFDYLYPSLLLMSHVTAVLCEEEPQEEEDLSHLGTAASPHVQLHSR